MAATRATMVKPSGSILEELEARKEATRKSRNTVVVRTDANGTSESSQNSHSAEQANGRKTRNTFVSKEQRAIVPHTIEYPNTAQANNGNEVHTGYAIRQHRPTMVSKKSSESREVQSTQSESSAVASPNARGRQLRVGTEEGIAELTSVGLKPSPPRIAQSSANKAAAESREKKGLVTSLREALEDAKTEEVVFPISQYIDSVIQSALLNVATRNATM